MKRHPRYDVMLGDEKVSELYFIVIVYAITTGIQIGEDVPGVMVMRERVIVGFGFELFERPSSVSLGLQRNAGGLFLGEDLKTGSRR